MKRIVLLPIVCLIFFSCEKEIPLDAEYTEPKITLNAVMYEDSTIRVHLSKSLSVIDNGTLDNITGATVELIDPSGNLIEVLSEEGNGFYESNTNAAVGIAYTLRAAAGTYPTVRASDVIKPQASVSFYDSSSFTTVNDDVFEVKFNLSDNANGEGYFRVTVFEKYVDPNTGQSYLSNVYFSPVDGRFQNNGNDNYQGEAFLTSASLDLATGPLTIWTYLNPNNYPPGSSLIVKVESLSKVGYEYFLSYQRAMETQGNFFAQPVLVRSNVEEGHGVFMGISENGFEVNF